MTLGLVAIVRNEEAVIDRFLDSALAVCDAATILDTGSTDGTISRLEARGITSHQRPFDGFGPSRSAAFALAWNTADFLLALDADMTVEVDPGFAPDPAVDAYMLEMGSAAFSYRLPLLLNGQRRWKSIGAVHEYSVMVDGSLGVRVPTDAVRVTHHGDGRASPDKSRWHAELLRADLERDPDNPRTVFYLAQTLSDLGQRVEARNLYRRRAGMAGYVEEAFLAAHRAALFAPDWPTQRDELWRAWMMRPSRLEPAYALARGLNARDQHTLAYAVASTPIAPTTDTLFVETAAWRYGLDFERHIAAWWVGRRDESVTLGRELLGRDLPESIRAAVERNLAIGQSSSC